MFAADTYTRKLTASGMNEPNCIAFGPTGEIYVVSRLNNRIYRFTAAGDYTDNFTGGTISSPMSVAIYDGEVFVTGGGSHTLTVFGLDGTFLREFDTQSTIPAPQGTAFDTDGTLIMASFSNDRVARMTRQAEVLHYFNHNGIDIGRSVAFLPTAAHKTNFVRGDFNGDGDFDIADPIATLLHLFAGMLASQCLAAGDTNDDGLLNLADAVAALNFLFGSGSVPASPFPGSGPDPTADGLVCY